MQPPPHRVAEVFREGWEGYRGAHLVPPRLVRVARHIMACRTAALGGRLHRCDACGAEVPLYNSCRDRHCPTCQTLRKQRWLEMRRAEILPVPYFHVAGSKGPPLAAPAGATSRARLSVPAGAASGNSRAPGAALPA